MNQGRIKRKRKIIRQKVCRLCEKSVSYIDFKDKETLTGFQTVQGKIFSRRITGNCYHHQQMITEAIKRARNLAIVL